MHIRLTDFDLFPRPLLSHPFSPRAAAGKDLCTAGGSGRVWGLKAQAGLARPIASGLLLAERSSTFAIDLPIALACNSSDRTIGKSGVPSEM